MSETSDCATPDQPKIPKEFLLKFLALAQELHGAPTEDFEPSKPAALKVFQRLARSQSEDAARHSMRQDREGTLSLSDALICKASRDGWAPPLKGIPPANTLGTALDRTTFLTSGAFWFFRRAIDEML